MPKFMPKTISLLLLCFSSAALAQLPSSTTLTVPSNPSTYGQIVTLTATVSPAATGTVEFLDGFNILGNAVLDSSSRAMLKLRFPIPRTYRIRAIYQGSNGVGGSTSALLTLSVRATKTNSTGATYNSPRQGFLIFKDLTGDGNPDILIGEATSAVGVFTYVGLGGGTYSNAPIGSNVPFFIGGFVSDCNNDGIPDLFDITGQKASLGTGNGSFTYTGQTACESANGPPFDYNRDGFADHFPLAGPTASLRVGTPSGAFVDGPVQVKNAYGLVDLDGDGIADRYSVDYPGVTTLTRWNQIASLLPIRDEPAVGDFNGDGLDDFAGADSASRYFLYLTKPDGTSGDGIPISISNPTTRLLTADMNGDGILDLVTLESGTIAGTTTVSYRLGSGTGTFGQPGILALNSQVALNSLTTLTDYNGDGYPDIQYLDNIGATAFLMGSGIPTTPFNLSFTPVSGAGAGTPVSFTATYSHSLGVENLYRLYILFLSTPNVTQFVARGSCLIEYNTFSDGVRLINDAGIGWLGPVAGQPRTGPGSSTPLTNSYCSVTPSQVDVTTSGSQMRFTVRPTFTNSLGFVLGTFIQGLDAQDNWSGMQQFGNWVLPQGAPKSPGPQLRGLDTSSTGNNSALYTLNLTESGAPLVAVHLRISSSIDGNAACHAIYFPPADTFNLVDDTGLQLVSPNNVPARTNTVLTNSRCSLAVSGASRTGTNQSSVKFPMSFNPATFNGVKAVYGNAFDGQGYLTHWVIGNYIDIH